MATFRFRILTPLGSRYDNEIDSVVVPAANGKLGVLAGHAPMVSSTVDGELSITEPGGKKIAYIVEPGVLEVKETEVVLLADQADLVDGSAKPSAVSKDH